MLFKEKLKKQYKAAPVKTTAAIISMVAGIVSILTFTGTVIDWVDEQVVSENEMVAQLKISENRILKVYKKEALLIRNAILSDLNAQVAAVTKLLGSATKIGEAEVYKLRIEGLNKRIDELRGEG